MICRACPPFAPGSAVGLGFSESGLIRSGTQTNEGVILTAAGQVAVRVLHTDEELMIAKTDCSVLGFDRTTGE